MSRYIDAEWLMNFFVDIPNNFTLTIGNLRATVDDAPTIDIVRCGECKKANTENCSHSYWDDDWGEWRVGYKGDDWFCADGEKEGE